MPSAVFLVFPYRDGASVAESAMRSRLRRVKGCAAMAAPLHMPVIAAAPHRTHRPARLSVGVAVRAARSVGTRSSTKLLGKSSRGSATATLLPQATDRLSAQLIQPWLAALTSGSGCLHICAQIVALQTSDEGLSFIDIPTQRCGV